MSSLEVQWGWEEGYCDTRLCLGIGLGCRWEGHGDKDADRVLLGWDGLEGRMEDGRTLRWLGLWVNTSDGN